MYESPSLKQFYMKSNVPDNLTDSELGRPADSKTTYFHQHLLRTLLTGCM